MYEEFYHLQAKPFRLSPDPSFFFASRGHKRALSYLRYGLSQGEGFVVITGAPGTGKTTLAQILLEELDQYDMVVAHLTTTQLDAKELLSMVAAAFGLRYDGVEKAGLLKVLEAFFIARAREHKRVLLVVDEVQNLPPKSLEELRMLSNLQVGGTALLQTFMLGQAQFRKKLDHPSMEQLRQRVISNYHLSELGSDECQSYIESRLQHVGWTGDPEITKSAYEGIYKYTKGVPRRINMLCDRLMLFSFLDERHDINAAVLREVTDELQQEISGKKIKISDLSDDSSPSSSGKKANPKKKNSKQKSSKQEKTKKKNSKKTAKSSVDLKIEELEARNKQSAYAQVEQDKKEDVSEPDLDLGQIENNVPEEEFANVVAQAGADDAVGSYEDAVVMQANSTSQNKDRFQVISGGRDNNQSMHDRKLNTPTNSAAAPESKTDSTADTRSESEGEVPNPTAPNDTDEVILRKILRLVLAYHRSPRSFPGLDDPTQPLPRGVRHILSLAVSDDEVLRSLRQISVMGISPAMLRAAVRFFVRRVMFMPGGDDYRVLGLALGATQGEVEEHYGLLMRLMRKEKESTSDENSVTRIGEAYERLCQSEITNVPIDVLREDIDADIDELDELDLDLAPSQDVITSGRVNSRSNFSTDRTADLDLGEQRTSVAGRNVMLIVGTIVVVFVLYLTQIISTDDQDAETELMATAVLPEQKDSPQPEVLPEAVIEQENAEISAAEPSAEQNKIDNEEEAKRQKIMADLRVQAAAIDKTKREAEALERAKLEAKIRASKQAQIAAEMQANQETQARIKAEVAQKAATQAKLAAEAKAKARATKNAKARAQAQAKAKAVAKKARVVAASSSAQTTNKKASKVNADAEQLNSFVTRLETAYENGNLDALSNLFGIRARTNDQTNLVGIRKDYKSLFDKTSSRKITLKNLQWDIDNNYARGIGSYKAVVRHIGASIDTVSTGKVTLQLEGSSGRFQITRFYFTETKLVSGGNVSDAELDKVLAKFKSAYQAGNIEQFVALFSPSAKTNDRSTLQGIRQDYVELFEGTTLRKIEIKNLKWSWQGDVARGEGSYVVEVQPKGNENTNVYRGKLWFNVGQSGSKLLISNFAFE